MIYYSKCNKPQKQNAISISQSNTHRIDKKEKSSLIHPYSNLELNLKSNQSFWYAQTKPN